MGVRRGRLALGIAHDVAVATAHIAVTRPNAILNNERSPAVRPHRNIARPLPDVEGLTPLERPPRSRRTSGNTIALAVRFGSATAPDAAACRHIDRAHCRAREHRTARK